MTLSQLCWLLDVRILDGRHVHETWLRKDSASDVLDVLAQIFLIGQVQDQPLAGDGSTLTLKHRRGSEN